MKEEGTLLQPKKASCAEYEEILAKKKNGTASCLKTGLPGAQDGALVVSDLHSWLADNGACLAAKGFEIYGADRLFKRKVRFDEAALHIEVSSGIDWFDLKGEASFGEEKLPLSSVMQAINNNERFVKLSDGTEGIIPKKWIDNLSYASSHDAI